MERILSGKEQERMCNNGWVLNTAKPLESTEQLIERMNRLGYKDVRVYTTTTYVRGYYKKIAMCKRG